MNQVTYYISQLLKLSAAFVAFTLSASVMLAVDQRLVVPFAGVAAAYFVFATLRPEAIKYSFLTGRIVTVPMAVVSGLFAVAFLFVPSDAEALATLRKSNPTAYLEKIQKSDPELWMKELAVFDPPRLALENESLARANAEDEKASEAARLAAVDATKADALAKLQLRDAEFATLKIQVFELVQQSSWAEAGELVHSAQSIFTDQYPAIVADLEIAALAVIEPLPASDLEANQAGYKFLALLRPDTATYSDKASGYTAKIEDLRQASVKKLRQTVDKVEGITWLKHPNQPTYTNSRSTVFLYIGQKAGQRPFLRMVVQYAASDWLFVDKVYAWYDVAGTANGLKEPLISGSFNRDHNTTIWEWVDIVPDAYQLSVLRSLAEAPEAILRFEGQQYRKDATLSQGDKKAILEMLAAYSVLSAG